MSTIENTLVAHRWVRIMCDYCADGVWDRDGAGCMLHDLPASPGLLERIREWQNLYERKDCDDLVIEWEHCHRFSEEGLAIARAVKAELPDWTVVYYDETAGEEAAKTAEAPRAVFEYEILPTDAETHVARLAAAVEQLGLVAGETRVREGDVEGVFVQALNIQHGRLWIAVRADEPVVMNGDTYGHRRHFYGDWVKVSYP